ncbi:light-harvesting complex-like protein OHP2, chloroplastic isoform X1 [Dendrobium catenatum]|uniref:light-harvesting complex-like protein OHP2, chloroplastic isoform X1 n=1 Tax=Dendrobium catenatum TaxID=906689 RepID=UPI00109FCE2B|nr:light-harvesting complex-like protein OHP2, chloroplastic isoform X1 [Dendrobium catenatum]
MSIASTIPCIKIKISPSPSPHTLKICSPIPYFTVRSSKAEGPLRRPTAPSLSPPISTAPSLSPPPSLSPAPPAKPVAAPSAGEVKGVVTLEFQRRMAKELQDYFRQKKLEEANQGPFFGFLGKNEIANGRYIYNAIRGRKFHCEITSFNHHAEIIECAKDALVCQQTQ